MPKVLENVIVGAVPNPENFSVVLRWGNSATTVVSFRYLAGKGVFAAFDAAACFTRAAIGERGRSLEWPDEIDFCADALWFGSRLEDAPQEQRRRSGG